MWLSNTNIKKLKRPKPNEKRGREPSPAKRENPCRSEPMSSFSLPSCRPCPGDALVVPNLGMSLPCQAPTIFLPQFVANPSPKPQASIADPFQRLCFCFGMGFGVCVCVLAWISSWVSSFACISGLGVGLSLHFGLGFCWLFSIFCFRFGLLIFLLVFSSFSALFIFLVLLH